MSFSQSQSILTRFSCVLLFYSLRHDEVEGTSLSAHARTRRDLESHPEHELEDNESDRETKNSNDLDPESRMMSLGRDHEKAAAPPRSDQSATAPYSDVCMNAANDTAATHTDSAQPAPAMTRV